MAVTGQHFQVSLQSYSALGGEITVLEPCVSWLAFTGTGIRPPEKVKAESLLRGQTVFAAIVSVWINTALIAPSKAIKGRYTGSGKELIDVWAATKCLCYDQYLVWYLVGARSTHWRRVDACAQTGMLVHRIYWVYYYRPRRLKLCDSYGSQLEKA